MLWVMSSWQLPHATHDNDMLIDQALHDGRDVNNLPPSGFRQHVRDGLKAAKWEI